MPEVIIIPLSFCKEKDIRLSCPALGRPKKDTQRDRVQDYQDKGGSSGAANTGNEPYSEFYAYQIAQAIGLNAVVYDLECWKGILASECKLFTDIDTAFVPIGRLVRSGGLQACLATILS